MYKIYDGSNNWMATERTKVKIKKKLKMLKKKYPRRKFRILHN